MAYTYKQQWVSSTKYSIKCPFTMTAEYITVHNTYNDAPAKNEASYHNSNKNQVSFHIAIDDVEAIEVVPLNRNAWHCGDGQGNGNRKSIGIEICYSKSGGSKYIKAEENAVELIARMLKERGWGIDRVKKHQDWSGKYCPHRILDEGRWNSFLNRIKEKLSPVVNPYANKLGYNAPKDSKAYRIHTGAFGSKALAEKAKVDFVKDKFLGYAEVFGNDKDGYRLQSGKYTSQKEAENVAIKMLDAKKIGYASIIGTPQ